MERMSKAEYFSKDLTIPVKEMEFSHQENEYMLLSETCVEVSCSLRQSMENPLRRRTEVTFTIPEPQPEEWPRKRRRAETEEAEASCSFAKKECKKNPLRRDKVDALPERPESQPKETPEQRKETETEKNDANKESREKTGPQSSRRINAFRNAKFRGRYILGKMLGRGGFGAVFAGIRKSDGNKVAVKIVIKQGFEEYITLPGDTRRVPLEVALMEIVCKPPRSENVIELLEWYDTPTSFILILEHPDHCIDLFTFCELHHNNCLTESEARTIMEQVVQAASHCRERGVFHRDIKEENILVNPDTLSVKLIDFGCGELIKDTPYTQFIGTANFIPPEFYIDNEYKEEPTTVWSLGILLYSLLCGNQPFEDMFEILESNLKIPSSLPKRPLDLIKWCLEYDPHRRPSLDKVLTHDWFLPLENP